MILRLWGCWWASKCKCVWRVKNYICRWMRETYIITHSLQFISIKISFADKNLLHFSLLCSRKCWRKKLSCYMENKNNNSNSQGKSFSLSVSCVKINGCRSKSLFLLISYTTVSLTFNWIYHCVEWKIISGWFMMMATSWKFIFNSFTVKVFLGNYFILFEWNFLDFELKWNFYMTICQ